MGFSLKPAEKAKSGIDSTLIRSEVAIKRVSDK